MKKRAEVEPRNSCSTLYSRRGTTSPGPRRSSKISI